MRTIAIDQLWEIAEARPLSIEAKELRVDCDGIDGDEAANLATVLEADYAVNLGEEGVVLAAAYVCAGLERGPTLTDEDGAAGDGFAAEALDAEPLCI